MKRLFMATILICVLIAFGLPMAIAGSAKVEVCHVPPDDPANFHTIKISEKALEAHLNHGDWPGSCDEFCDTLCDDGDACTIDHDGNCEENGCYYSGDVECDDGLGCTTDSCDSAVGCVNSGIDCDDGDPCTIDACVEPDGSCSNTDVSCPDMQECQPSTGECVDISVPETWTCVCVGGCGNCGYGGNPGTTRAGLTTAEAEVYVCGTNPDLNHGWTCTSNDGRIWNDVTSDSDFCSEDASCGL